jgi:hypothetical protein
MMMLNPPIFVEDNDDYVVNETNLKCSPPRSSYRRFNKKME